jgi:hypothetical protein
VKVDDELDHWVWFERLERKCSIGKYSGKGHWRYRHPMAHSEPSCAANMGEAPEQTQHLLTNNTATPSTTGQDEKEPLALQ